MTRVLFVVNGGETSAVAMRARAFAEAFSHEYRVAVVYRTGSRAASIARFLAGMWRERPDVCYVMDLAYSGILAAGIYRLARRTRLIVDTGDAIAELARSVGERGPIGLWLTDWLERFGLWIADAVVVRGTRHLEVLGEIGKPVQVVQDGVDIDTFIPVEDSTLRASLAPGARFTIGLVGSSIWSDRLGICYGWELVEVVNLLRDEGVGGIMVGGGSGIERLEERCRELGIADRVCFAGYVDYDELPRYLGSMDFCLSTQTNDIPGRVRTTGKLPIYLAAGGVVLASRVGEAEIVLDDSQLVDYEGVVDRAYPERLAARIRTFIADPQSRINRIADNRAIAARAFDYRDLSQRVVNLVTRVEGSDD